MRLLLSLPTRRSSDLAGAGSGKTTSLVERMVNLIYKDVCPINKIVAITFTKKAADELKLRFQSELEKKWKVEIDTRSEEHTSELQSRGHLVCRLLLEK